MSVIPLRALPRAFVPGATAEDGPIELPKEEVNKFRRVLRLEPGTPIAILPDDGTIIRAVFQTYTADPIEVCTPDVESPIRFTLLQALPKGDKLDEIIRFCTGLGVAEFVVFPSERTVVRWDDKKLNDRLERLRTIAREAAEVSFRTRIPKITALPGLAQALKAYPDCLVLSEVEGVVPTLPRDRKEIAVMVGPEGGWAPKELEQIGPRGVTLGPRVLRVEQAGPAAAAFVLLP
jgi:16S rRNA (uracil1498-N3)-methyltransferase